MSRLRDIAQASASPKLLIQRGLLVACLVTGVTLLVLGRANHPALAEARIQVLSTLAPVFEAVRAPVESFRNAQAYLADMASAHALNAQLQQENDGLRRWQAVAVALEQENKALRELMAYQPVAQLHYTSAKVIADLQSGNAHSLLINAGSRDGIARYQPVIDAYGLIGRVMELSSHHARVLSITDVNSRIPVVTSKSDTRAILTGTGGEMLKLSFVAPHAAPKPGEMILTTDDGALVPSGIMVGKIFSVSDDAILVKPIRPLDAPGYVRIVQYEGNISPRHESN
jgi:rod shape-determining protein MreC